MADGAQPPKPGHRALTAGAARWRWRRRRPAAARRGRGAEPPRQGCGRIGWGEPFAGWGGWVGQTKDGASLDYPEFVEQVEQGGEGRGNYKGHSVCSKGVPDVSIFILHICKGIDIFRLCKDLRQKIVLVLFAKIPRYYLTGVRGASSLRCGVYGGKRCVLLSLRKPRRLFA